MRWSIVSVLVLQNLHLGSPPLWRILARKFLVKRLWSCAATINPSISALSPAVLSHWWVSCKSTSLFCLRSGYWPCKGFDFQAVSIAFYPFSLAILFNFWVFSVFFISPSNSVSRYKLISRANFLASFTKEWEPFSFSCFKASYSMQSSDKFKYRRCFIRKLELIQTPPLATSWEVKTVNISLWVMHAMCCHYLSNFSI